MSAPPVSPMCVHVDDSDPVLGELSEVPAAPREISTRSHGSPIHGSGVGFDISSRPFSRSPRQR